MATQSYHYNFTLRCCFTAVLSLFFCCHCFPQTNTNKDSAKSKAISKTPVNDSILKYGSGKVVLSGRTKTIPLPALQDADNDGVPDQLDLEPNTPKGVEVDSHGRALDTDGDGVPDYKDKEKLTLQKCFPVDSNGVGKCSEPVCCNNTQNDDSDMICCCISCSMTALPSIQFKKGSYELSDDAVAKLTYVAKELSENPFCNIKFIGFYEGSPSKKAKKLSWYRVYAVMKYLIEKQGANESRFIFLYGQYGNSSAVDLVPTRETEPNFLTSPSPGWPQSRYGSLIKTHEHS